MHGGRRADAEARDAASEAPRPTPPTPKRRRRSRAAPPKPAAAKTAPPPDAAKTRRILGRDRQDHRLCAAHRAGHPHLPVPALQHSVGLDGEHAADRRLSVRREIRLWLQPLFLPLRPGRRRFWQGRIFGSPPKRGDVVVFKLPSDPFHRLHQAGDRPARRPHPDDRRPALHQRQAVPKVRVADYVETIDGYQHHVPRYRETLPDGKTLLRARPRPGRPGRQHRRLCRAGRPLFHDGRQPRQFGRQPRRSGLCSGRKPCRQGRIHLLLDQWQRALLENSGTGRGRSATAGSSRSSTEPAETAWPISKRSLGHASATRALLDARADPCQRRRGGLQRAAGISRRPRARPDHRRKAARALSGRSPKARWRSSSTRWRGARPAPPRPRRRALVRAI